MKILIISRSFYPLNTPRSYRTTELAVELAKRKDVEVTVCTNYDSSLHDDFLIKNNLNILDLNGHMIEKRKHALIKRYLLRILGILMEYPSILYTFKVKSILEKIQSEYNLIISIAVPHTIHWGVAAAIKKNKRFIWVADCGDPYMGNTLDKIRKPFYFSFVEKWWCRKADFITVPISEAVNAYYPEFVEKIRIIPQGVDFDNIRKYFIPYKKNDPIQFLYAGSFIEGYRDPRPILEYLNTVNHDFKFFIYSNDTKLTNELALKSNGKIILKEPIPREDLLKQMSSMDFLINLENGVSTASPSKLIEYALTNRPILSLNSNDLDKTKIQSFLNRDYLQSLKIVNIERYSIANVTDQFLALIL